MGARHKSRQYQHPLSFPKSPPSAALAASFLISLKSGETLHARDVVLALGVQGNPRRVSVPGGDLPCVQYTLESPDAFRGETIVVIGAGDAAIENAIALSRNNSVTLINRNSGFPRAKDANAARITRAIAAGRIKCLEQAELKSVHPAPAGRTEHGGALSPHDLNSRR